MAIFVELVNVGQWSAAERLGYRTKKFAVSVTLLPW